MLAPIYMNSESGSTFQKEPGIGLNRYNSTMNRLMLAEADKRVERPKYQADYPDQLSHAVVCFTYAQEIADLAGQFRSEFRNWLRDPRSEPPYIKRMILMEDTYYDTIQEK